MKVSHLPSKIAKAGLSCALVFALTTSALPLAGCSPSQTEADSNAPTLIESQIDPEGLLLSYDTSEFVAPEVRFESFDDGSDQLDIAETHVSSNTSTQEINVTTVGTSFTSQIDVGDITLTGGMANWTVNSVERQSDTHLAINVTRPESVSPFGNGADVAGIEIAARCVQPVADDLSALDQWIGFMENPEAGDAWLAENPVPEQTDPNLPEPVSVTEGEFVVLDETDPAAAEAMEAENEPLSINIPFVTPFLTVDVADTQIEEDRTVFHLVASNFALAQNLAVSDFSISLAQNAPEGTVAPELLGVSRLGDFEMEAIVSGNALEADSVFDYAVLNFHGSANGTGGDVCCSLTVPDAWVHANAEIEDGQVSIEADMINSDEEITSENTTVSVLKQDGTLQEIANARITSSDDGTSNISFSAEALGESGENPIVVVDPSQVDHASGTEVDPDPYFIPVSVSASAQAQEANFVDLFAPKTAWAAEEGSIFSKIASWASSIDLSELAFSAAKGGLGALASSGWSAARSTILQDTFLGDRSNMQIYNLVSAINDQMSELNTQVKQLSDTVTANYYGGIVNDANQIMTDIKSDYASLTDLYTKVLSEKEGSAEQSAAIKNLMDKRSGTIDSLVKNMNRLASKIECADATRGLGLIASYDAMAAKSYNWAGEAAAPRMAYRAALSALWTDATSLIYVVCGSDEYKSEYATTLATLEKATEKVNSIVSSSEVKESEYERECSSPKTESGKAYYCNTTAAWYVLYKGSDSPVGWNEVNLKKINKGKMGLYSSQNPFSSYVSNKQDAQWKSEYMNGSDAKLLVARCRPNSSLQQELRSFVASVPKYFLVGAKFECKGGKCPKNQNDWTFDTYTEDSATTASTFEAAKTLYKSEITTKGFIKKKTVSTVHISTPLEDMFVLAKVSV